MIKERGKTEALIKQILRHEFLGLKPTRYVLSESVGDGTCELSINVGTSGASTHAIDIVGRGVGFVDALYHGLIDHFAREYPSLRTLTVTNFEVQGNMATGHDQGTDAEVEVELSVINSESEKFVFQTGARSLVAATCNVVFEMAEYFINSERAYITLYRAVADARSRNRQDLVESYQSQMAEVVKSTSYSEVIEALKKN